jgi:hypothetical protein
VLNNLGLYPRDIFFLFVRIKTRGARKPSCLLIRPRVKAVYLWVDLRTVRMHKYIINTKGNVRKADDEKTDIFHRLYQTNFILIFGSSYFIRFNLFKDRHVSTLIIITVTYNYNVFVYLFMVAASTLFWKDITTLRKVFSF